MGIGQEEMLDYLEFVRANFETRTEWFDIDLPWVKKDAMEVSVYRSKRHDLAPNLCQWLSLIHI